MIKICTLLFSLRLRFPNPCKAYNFMYSCNKIKLHLLTINIFNFFNELFYPLQSLAFAL